MSLLYALYGSSHNYLSYSLWNPSLLFKATRTESHKKRSHQREWGYCRCSEISWNTRVTNDIWRGLMLTRIGKPNLVLSFSLSLCYFCSLGSFSLLTVSSARSSFMCLHTGNQRNPVQLIYFHKAKGLWLLWESTSGTMSCADRGDVCTSFIQSWIHKFLPLPNPLSEGINNIFTRCHGGILKTLYECMIWRQIFLYDTSYVWKISCKYSILYSF